MARKSSKPLSDTEKETIIVLSKEGHSDEAIAEKLGRNVQTIARHRKMLNIYKKGGGKLVAELKEKSDEEIAATLSSKPEEQQRHYWQFVLRKSDRYLKLRQMFPTSELEEFENKWIDFHIDLEDLTPAEEDMVELMIIYRLRIDQNQKDFKQAQDVQNQLQRQVGNRELDVENAEDLRFHEMSIANGQYLMAINKDIKDLTDKLEKLHRALNTTREQREKSKNIGQERFFDLVRAMQNKDFRKESGEYTERMKEATRKTVEKFKQPHKFTDTVTEPILLDGADFVREGN